MACFKCWGTAPGTVLHLGEGLQGPKLDTQPLTVTRASTLRVLLACVPAKAHGRREAAIRSIPACCLPPPCARRCYYCSWRWGPGCAPRSPPRRAPSSAATTWCVRWCGCAAARAGRLRPRSLWRPRTVSGDKDKRGGWTRVDNRGGDGGAPS